jgi:hypothetical protein
MYLPVRPQTAIFSPAPMVRKMFFKARTAPSSSGKSVELYDISVSLNSV